MRNQSRFAPAAILVVVLSAVPAWGQAASRVQATGKAAGTDVRAADEAKLDALVKEAQA